MRLTRWLRPALFLLAALPLLTWFGAGWLAETVLVRLLESRGVEVAHLDITVFGFHDARFDNVRLGPDGEVSARRLEATYSLDSLLDGRLDALTVEGPVLVLDAGSGRIDGLEALFAGPHEAAAGAPTFPADRLQIEDLHLRVREADRLLVTITGDAAVRSSADASSILSGEANLAVAGNGFSADAHLELAKLDLSLATLPEGRLHIGNGTMSVDGSIWTGRGELASTVGNGGPRLNLALTGRREDGVTAEIEAALAVDQALSRWRVDGPVSMRLASAEDDAASLEAKADLTALYRPAQGAYRAALTFGRGRGRLGKSAIEGMTGELFVAGDASDLTDAAVDLEVDRVALAGTTAEPVRVTASYSQGEVLALVSGEWNGSRISVGARAPELTEPGSVHWSAAGTVSARTISRVPKVSARGGDMAFEASLVSSNPRAWLASRTPEEWLDLFTGKIVLNTNLGAVDIAGLSAARLQGPVAIYLQDGAAELDLPAPVRIEGVDPGDIPVLALTEPADLTLTESSSAILERSPDGGWRLRAHVALEAAVAGSSARLAADLESDLRDAWNMPAGELALDNVPLTGMAWSGHVGLRDAHYEVDAYEASLTTDLSAAPLRLGPLSGQALAVQVSGRISGDGGSIAAELDEATQLSARGLRVGDITLPPALRLSPRDGPFHLSVDMASGGMTAEGRITGLAGTVRLPVGGQQVAADLDLPAVMIELAGDRIAFNVAGASLILPGWQVRLADLSLGGLYEPRGDVALSLNAGRVTDLREPALVIPLELTGRVSGTLPNLDLAARLADSGERLVLQLRGRHELDTGFGGASLTLQPLVFTRSVLTLSDIFPALGGSNIALDGQTEAYLRFAWQPDGPLDSHGTIMLDAAEVSYGELSAYGARTAVTFEDLLALTTEGEQTLYVDRLDVGMPMNDGEMSFAINGVEDLFLEVRRLSLFGGQVTTGPMHLNPQARPLMVPLQARGISIAQILTFSEVAQVQANGTFSGVIPVQVTEGGDMLLDGTRLQTDVPGRLSYQAEDVEGTLSAASEATDILTDALSDFRYDALTLQVDETDGQQDSQVQLQLSGHSPRVYGGVPMLLNVDIGGPLRDIFNRTVTTISDPRQFLSPEELEALQTR